MEGCPAQAGHLGRFRPANSIAATCALFTLRAALADSMHARTHAVRWAVHTLIYICGARACGCSIQHSSLACAREPASIDQRHMRNNSGALLLTFSFPRAACGACCGVWTVRVCSGGQSDHRCPFFAYSC
uniref:Uncharacterized protein n=1 Tax=Haptolina ericina TaxID=156174 RepID=A0A7S3F2W7_9EUKA